MNKKKLGSLSAILLSLSVSYGIIKHSCSNDAISPHDRTTEIDRREDTHILKKEKRSRYTSQDNPLERKKAIPKEDSNKKKRIEYADYLFTKGDLKAAIEAYRELKDYKALSEASRIYYLLADPLLSVEDRAVITLGFDPSKVKDKKWLLNSEKVFFKELGSDKTIPSLTVNLSLGDRSVVCGLFPKKELGDKIEELLSEERYDSVMNRLEESGDFYTEVGLLRHLGRYEEALSIAVDNNLHDIAARMLLDMDNPNMAFKYFSLSGDIGGEIASLSRMEDYRGAVELSIENNMYDDAEYISRRYLKDDTTTYNALKKIAERLKRDPQMRDRCRDAIRIVEEGRKSLDTMGDLLKICRN